MGTQRKTRKRKKTKRKSVEHQEDIRYCKKCGEPLDLVDLFLPNNDMCSDCRLNPNNWEDIND